MNKAPQSKASSKEYLKTDFIHIEKSFFNEAPSLRSYFESQFADPQSVDGKRFVWDYWNVPDQYNLVRTPAYHYFPPKLYMKLHRQLVAWGRKTLGCWDISPPWLSFYTEGNYQGFHSDVPHGPWAYVYSLTPWKTRKFLGGETLILKPEVLSYWSHFGGQHDREENSFLYKIPAEFNQLLVFDPRLPHAVKEVRGVRDPREARLVIHGWFMEPKTYIEGPLPKRGTEKILNRAFEQVEQLVLGSDPVIGTLSLQISVNSQGRVIKCQYATQTLRQLDGQKPSQLLTEILKLYRSLSFAKNTGVTHMTIPLIFQ